MAIEEETSSCSDAQVITGIRHEEPAAIIAPGEAAAIEDRQMVGRIERMIGWEVTPTPPQDINGGDANQPVVADAVCLLRFNRRPEDMVSTLEEGASLRACRANLAEAGYDWKLISGTFVFVHPEQYASVMRAIVGWELKGHHVIISESLEYLLEEALNDIGKGAWAKDRQHLYVSQASGSEALASSGSQEDQKEQQHQGIHHEQDQGEWWDLLKVERTFICCDTIRQRNSKSVVQSTTEANPRAGGNPRRALASLDDF